MGGKGIITEELARCSNKVVTIEIDSKLAYGLTKKLNNNSNVEIINQDFLAYPIQNLGRCKIFSNIPFNITTDVIDKILELKNVVDIYLVIQYEAFLRYKGAPYFKESLKSLQYKPFFEITMFHKFNSVDFTPVPKADIVFAHFMPKTKPDISEENKKIYLDFLTYVFTANGSTLKQKLSKIFSYEQIKRSMKTIGYTTESSVSNISYEQWIKLFNIFKLCI